MEVIVGDVRQWVVENEERFALIQHRSDELLEGLHGRVFDRLRHGVGQKVLRLHHRTRVSPFKVRARLRHHSRLNSGVAEIRNRHADTCAERQQVSASITFHKSEAHVPVDAAHQPDLLEELVQPLLNLGIRFRNEISRLRLNGAGHVGDDFRVFNCRARYVMLSGHIAQHNPLLLFAYLERQSQVALVCGQNELLSLDNAVHAG